MKAYKLAALLLSGGMLLGLGSCGKWLLNVLYLLPEFADSLQSLTGGGSTGTSP